MPSDSENESSTQNPPPPRFAREIALHALSISSIKNLVNTTLEQSPPIYTHWHRLFKTTFGKFGLLQHVDGFPPVPIDKFWVHLDFTVLSWMYATINPEIVLLIGSDDPTAHEFWLSLEGLFRDNKKARAIQLETEFRSLRQGVLPINEYYSKLKALVDGLTDVGNPVSDDYLVLQTIGGLNEEIKFVALLTRKCEAALSRTDDFGWTPLHYAVHFGVADILDEFMDHIDSSIAAKRDKQGMSIVHIAAREGEASILKALVNKFPQIWDLQDNKGRTAFHLAVETGKLDCANFILGTEFSHDGLINQQDNDGNTALHLATIHGHNQKMFELLLKDCRVDKTARNLEGLTVIDIILMKEYGRQNS